MAGHGDSAGCSTSTTDDAPALDHDLWLDLPEVLVLSVLRFLPSESVFKFRSVCRKWRGILTDPVFLESRLGAPHRSPFCVLIDNPNKCFAVYSVATEQWFYPPYEALLSMGFFVGDPSMERIVLTAAAGGLVLLEVLPPEPRVPQGRAAMLGSAFRGIKYLVLLNPVNKSYRQLPNLEDRHADGAGDAWFPKVVGLNFDAESGAYQILARSAQYLPGGPGIARPGRSQFHVYDLEANSWEMIYDSQVTEGPEDWDKSYRILEPAVLHGGFWYYLTYAHHIWGPRMSVNPHVFRIKRGVAEAVQAPLPHEAGMIIDFLHLFVCQGKLILAGSVKTVSHLILNEWMSFRFWKLDEQGLEWVEYLTMPHYLVNYLGDRSVKRFALDLECSVDGDYICFWVGRPAGKLYRTIEIIMYSISKDLWWTVNSNVEMPRIACENGGLHGYRSGFSTKSFAYFLFKPNLNITLQK